MRTDFYLLFVIGANCAASAQMVTTPYQTTRNGNCPRGYSDGGDGSCYSCCDSYTARNDAYNRCAHDGGYLNDINNIYQNINLQSLAGYSDIWLGLTCLTNDRTSCVWDGTGVALNASSFSNFYGGSPNITEGPCVYMKGSDAKWYSADCAEYHVYSGCKYTPGIKVPYCSPSLTDEGYSTTFAFRGKCYWIQPGRWHDYNTNTYFCARSCGSMASIHSTGENNFIKSLAISDDDTGGYIFTGLKYEGNTGNYSWNDHSKYDYSNFGHEDIKMGYCVLMSTETDLIPSGMWLNSDCEQELTTICSKDWQNVCDTTTTRIPVTTAAPVICPSSQFFTGNGTIYSPGYPNGKESNYCEYLITVNEDQQAEISFTDLVLNYNTILSFYDTIVDSYPFQTVTYGSYGGLEIDSPTHVLRIIYNTTGDGSYWSGHYGPYYPSQNSSNYNSVELADE